MINEVLIKFYEKEISFKNISFHECDCFRVGLLKRRNVLYWNIWDKKIIPERGKKVWRGRKTEREERWKITFKAQEPEINVLLECSVKEILEQNIKRENCGKIMESFVAMWNYKGFISREWCH